MALKRRAQGSSVHERIALDLFPIIVTSTPEMSEATIDFLTEYRSRMIEVALNIQMSINDTRHRRRSLQLLEESYQAVIAGVLSSEATDAFPPQGYPSEYKHPHG